MTEDAKKIESETIQNPKCENKYLIALFAAWLNVILLIICFIFMMTYIVPNNKYVTSQGVDNKSSETNIISQSQPTLQFAPLHTFPLLHISDFQEIETVVIPVTLRPPPTSNAQQPPPPPPPNMQQQSPSSANAQQNTLPPPLSPQHTSSQRLYKVEAVDQFDGTAYTRLFLSMQHILDVSPSHAILYDESMEPISQMQFFIGEKICNETMPETNCEEVKNNKKKDKNNVRQLTFNRSNRSPIHDQRNKNKDDTKDNDGNDSNDDNKDDKKGRGNIIRVRDDSNMAMLTEAAAQGGIVIDASIIKISDVVDGLGTLSGDFGSLGIQGVNGLGGVTGVANGINDFATVTNGLGGITPIGNSLLGDKNSQPGRTFMSVQSIPTYDVIRTDMSFMPTITYAPVPTVYTIPTVAVSTVPWGVNYIPSKTASSTLSTQTTANIVCSNDFCYSIIPSN